jgi:hypothetical protein
MATGMPAHNTSRRSGRDDPTRMSGGNFARLMITSIGVGLLYTVFSTATISKCFRDTEGLPGSCVEISLQPQSYVYIILIALAIGAVVVGRRNAHSEAAEKRLVRYSCLAIIGVGAIFAALHSLAFHRWILGDIQDGSAIVLPFLSNATVVWSAASLLG